MGLRLDNERPPRKSIFKNLRMRSPKKEKKEKKEEEGRLGEATGGVSEAEYRDTLKNLKKEKE